MAFLQRSLSALLRDRTLTGGGQMLTIALRRTFSAGRQTFRGNGRTLLPTRNSIDGQTLLSKRNFHAVATDVLLFKDERNTFYRLISIGATFLGVAAIYNGLTFYKGSVGMASRFDRAKSSMDVDESSRWQRYKAWLFKMVSGDTIRYGVTSFMCLFGGLCVFGAVVIPVRCVHRMSLLKGGHRVSITTFGPYGFPRSHNIRVDDVSAAVTRKSYYSSIPLNVKGFYPGFRMDNQNGKFLNKALYDDVVSVQKIFKK